MCIRDSLYPRVSVSIVTGSPDKLLDMMNCNALDIVYFLDKKMYDPKWVKALEVPDRVIFVTSADSPLANASISLEEMIRQPLILTEKDASYRLLLEQHLASLELDIHPFLEIGNTEFIVRLLRDNQGVSFLPEFTVRQDIENGRLVPVHVPGFTMRIWKQIVYPVSYTHLVSSSVPAAQAAKGVSWCGIKGPIPTISGSKSLKNSKSSKIQSIVCPGEPTINPAPV